MGAMQVAVFNLMAYVIGLAILLIEPYAIRRMSWQKITELLGISRPPKIKDILTAFPAWAGYMLTMVVVTSLVATFVPSMNLNEQQQLDFNTGGVLMDKLYALVVIVIAAPVIEETIFRGYLQGSLRRFMPWWLGALITSALFGYVHGQWNVGIDVFVMSMVACYLRERTGAIWAGIGVHMIKNSLAYYLLFFAPPWLLKMIGG